MQNGARRFIVSNIYICPKCGRIAEYDSYYGRTYCTRTACDWSVKGIPSTGKDTKTRSSPMKKFKIPAVLIWAVISLFVLMQQAEITALRTNLTALKADMEKNEATRKIYSDLFLEHREYAEGEFMRLVELFDSVQFIDAENTLTIIRLVCDWRGFDYRIAYATAVKESGLNPDAVSVNDNGTTDWGVFAFNDVVLEQYGITPEIALNPYTATEYYIKIMSNLLDKYDGDLHYAFRCYYAGEYGASQGYGNSYADSVMSMLEDVM